MSKTEFEKYIEIEGYNDTACRISLSGGSYRVMELPAKIIGENIIYAYTWYQNGGWCFNDFILPKSHMGQFIIDDVQWKETPSEVFLVKHGKDVCWNWWCLKKDLKENLKLAHKAAVTKLSSDIDRRQLELAIFKKSLEQLKKEPWDLSK